ncbi:MAG: RDD family protein [bacterium]|nr:RDD family protein [bacterium]
MALLKVRTAQNVQLNYQLGSVGMRLLSALLDLFILVAYFFIVLFSINSILNINIFEDSMSLVSYVLLFIAPSLYAPILEYFWKGQTVGKKILSLKVTKVDGSAPSMGDIILRWLLRTIDVKFGFLFIFFLPKNPQSEAESLFYFWVLFFWIVPFPLVGILTMTFSQLNQRLGDLAANTTVIVNKRPFSLDDTILALTKEDYQPKYMNALKLRDKDIYIIKNALEHARKNHDYKSLDPLAEKAREILEINDGEKPLPMLESIVRDYNHLARQKDLND